MSANTILMVMLRDKLRQRQQATLLPPMWRSTSHPESGLLLAERPPQPSEVDPCLLPTLESSGAKPLRNTARARRGPPRLSLRRDPFRAGLPVRAIAR